MLLLLITGQRGQNIHLLKVEDVIFHVKSLELQFTVVLKLTRHGVHQDNITFQSYFHNKLLCIVSLLRGYIDRTSSLKFKRQSYSFNRPPFKGVASATISRGVKRVLHMSGINVKCVKPHSKRAASSSYAKAKVATLSSILRSAGWTHKKHI